MKIISLIFILVTTVATFGRITNNISSSKINHDGLQVSSIGDDGDDKAKSLVRFINQYRRENGLNEIPYSPWLTYVGRWHVSDLETNNPDSGSCNLHSWSNKGSWSQCCYTGDHARASCMWDKPREISKGAYKGNGFEIACGRKGISELTTYSALECWKGSSPHLDVILNRGIWAKYKWKAIGAGISSHYAVVWFAEESDTSN